MRVYLFLLFFIVESTQLPAQIIITIAGNGVVSYGGDGGPATAAQMKQPYAVILDAVGNYYIPDAANRRGRKVSTAGIITTFAGDGTAGYSGDGGPATAAQTQPTALTMDTIGNIYLSDYNNIIRKINPAGMISTIAGDPSSYTYNGDGISATAARLGPRGISIDKARNLYVADGGNHRIRKIDGFGIITTIAGTGVAATTGDGGPATLAQVCNPEGIFADDSGNVYFSCGAPAGGGYIRKIDAAGIISTIAGMGAVGYGGDGGPATAAQLNDPRHLFKDWQGNIYIPDRFNHVVRKINTSGIITTIAGNGLPGFSGDGGPATVAQLYYPSGVALDDTGNIYVADVTNVRIRKILSGNHIPVVIAGHYLYPHTCKDSTLSLNTWLAVNDADPGQTLTWTLITAPLHGTASVSYTTPVIMGAVVPSGLWYAPAAGYVGMDTFKVRVDDGISRYITTIYVSVDSAKPGAGSITGTNTMCPGDTLTLSNATAGGVWGSSNTSVATISATGFVIAITPGADTIRYVVSNACGSDTAIFPLTVNSAAVCMARVNAATMRPAITLQPNPAKEAFTFSLSSLTDEPVTIVIANMLGEKVKELNWHTNKSLEIAPDLPAGIYVVSAATARERYMVRLVVER